jgi:hypothetical protein
MLSKTLFGRLFQLVPGHFKRMEMLTYYEQFRLGNKVIGEFCYNYQPLGRAHSTQLSTVILRPRHGKFHFREDLRQVYGASGKYFEQELLSIGPHHKCHIEFEGLGKELIDLLDKKTDMDIMSCSCCIDVRK